MNTAKKAAIAIAQLNNPTSSTEKYLNIKKKNSTSIPCEDNPKRYAKEVVFFMLSVLEVKTKCPSFSEFRVSREIAQSQVYTLHMQFQKAIKQTQILASSSKLLARYLFIKSPLI
jgi:hypothetical protein